MPVMSPLDQGAFDLEANVSCIIEMMERLGPGLNVIALCQGAMPALAATMGYVAGSTQRILFAPTSCGERGSVFCRIVRQSRALRFAMTSAQLHSSRQHLLDLDQCVRLLMIAR